MNEQVMPKVNGESFRCSCGCNVFTKYEVGRYRCNGCKKCYESEDAAPEDMELLSTDVQQLKAEIAAKKKPERPYLSDYEEGCIDGYNDAIDDVLRQLSAV